MIFQVGSYKYRGKRIFRMAPIHHHFELKGVAEPKIIVRFWIITIILALVAISTLKMRYAAGGGRVTLPTRLPMAPSPSPRPSPAGGEGGFSREKNSQFSAQSGAFFG